MGARLNLTEAVLTRAHNLCIDQNGNIQVRLYCITPKVLCNKLPSYQPLT